MSVVALALEVVVAYWVGEVLMAMILAIWPSVLLPRTISRASLVGWGSLAWPVTLVAACCAAIIAPLLLLATAFSSRRRYDAGPPPPFTLVR